MRSVRLADVAAVVFLALLCTQAQCARSSPPPSGSAPAPSSAAADVPRHVLTYQFFGVNGVPKGEPHADVASAAKWTDWAMSNPAMSKTLSAAGIKTIFYTDPNRVAPRDKEYTADETEFAHDCSGKRILVLKGQKRYLTDPASVTTQQAWKSHIDTVMRQGHFDAIYDDTAGSMGSLSALPCGFQEGRWIDEHVTFVESAGVPVIVNAIGDGDLPQTGKGADATYSMSPIVQVVTRATNAIGGTFEDCYASPDHPSDKGGDVTAGSYWQQTENTELAIARLDKIFVCNWRSERESMADAVPARTYAEASFLLTYDIHTSMVRSQFLSPSWFNVGPEAELVALDPVVRTPQTIDALRASGGAYGREYRACYVAAVPVGPCAAVVNSSASGAKAFPFAGYRRTMVLQGAGILDGGTISTNGPAPGSLAPLTGVVAFK